MMVKLSECTLNYIKAVTNPFGYEGNELPCIPDLTILDSNKIVAKVRGEVTASATSGEGYVLFNPFMAVTNNTTGSGNYVNFPVLATGSNYAGTGITYAVAAGAITTVGVTGANSNSPYSSLANTVSYRLVAAGLKIQFVGNSLYNQGTVYLYRTASGNIPSGTVASVMMQDNYTRRLPLSKKTEYIYYSPTSTYYCDYHTYTSLAPASTQVNNYWMTLLITGGSLTNPPSFMYEAIAFYEIIGPGFPLSPSHGDPTGYAASLAAQSAVQQTAPTTSPESITQKVIKGTYEQLQNNVSGLVNDAIPMVTQGIANAITSAGTATIRRLVK